MNTAISICHGKFGRACLYQMNSTMTTHAHRQGHLTFLVEGAPGVQNISNRRYQVSHGSGCAINPWEPHDFIPAEEDSALFLVLYINQSWFLEAAQHEKYAFHFGRNEVEITDVIHRSISKVVMLLLDFCSAELFDGYVYELAQECLDQTFQRQDMRATVGKQHIQLNDYRIRNSIRILSENLGEEFTLKEVARASGLSRPHFFKLFRRQTGITPNLFLNMMRMERAIDRLVNTESTVIDLSYDLGFSSHSAFTRFFCRNVGMAPSEYRRVAHMITE